MGSEPPHREIANASHRKVALAIGGTAHLGTASSRGTAAWHCTSSASRPRTVPPRRALPWVLQGSAYPSAAGAAEGCPRGSVRSRLTHSLNRCDWPATPATARTPYRRARCCPGRQCSISGVLGAEPPVCDRLRHSGRSHRGRPGAGAPGARLGNAPHWGSWGQSPQCAIDSGTAAGATGAGATGARGRQCSTSGVLGAEPPVCDRLRHSGRSYGRRLGPEPPALVGPQLRPQTVPHSSPT